MAKQLKLVDYSDKVLHNPCETVSFPLDAETAQDIENMLFSIRPENLRLDSEIPSAAGMAANQWGINKRIFLYCPYGNEKNEILVIINPSYTPTAIAAQSFDWEGCFSVPLATGNVKRFSQINVEFQNTDGLTITDTLDGWEARVFQHETDHVNGHLFDDFRIGKCNSKKEFETYSELDKFYDKIRKTRKTK